MEKRVFISYAWTNDAYQKKVIDLATKLRNDGIDVILDKWDLHTGSDRFIFMEKSVNESDKVLILCNKVYKEKADNRCGGAGQETMIIAPEVYEKNAPEKFIPIIMERNLLGKEYIPQYLKSLIYIDYTDKDMEGQYQNLLYAIYGVTKDIKPRIGDVPSYIKERVSVEDLHENEQKKSNFSKRLGSIIEMINMSNFEKEHINLEIIGDMMGLESVNELNRYYYGAEEPPYEFIEKLCKVLGINEKWMKFGKDTPYRNELKTYYHAEEMLEEISGEKEVIFFTIKEFYRRELGVIVKKDAYIFQCYPRAFTFHADVGCGGAAELFSLYNFLKRLNQMGKMPSSVYCVSEDEFYKFLNGEIYSGLIRKPHRDYFAYMLDDFIDLYADDKEKDNYIRLYDKTFVDSQRLIKGRIEQVKKAYENSEL